MLLMDQIQQLNQKILEIKYKEEQLKLKNYEIDFLLNQHLVYLNKVKLDQ